MLARAVGSMCVVAASLVCVTAVLAMQPADAAARARTVVAQLNAREFASVEAAFTDRMKAALPPGRIGATWAMVLGQVGDFRAITATRTQATGGIEVAIVTCDFAHAKLDVQVAFDSAGRIAGFSMRPAAAPPVPYTSPSYVTPGSFAEQDQPVGVEPWVLPGTLSLPTGPGPFPAVVLIAGSGPNDRDETIAGNKPFKDLAGGLASRGIAVLRYDKRTKVYGAKLAALADFTVKQEVVDDAIEAVKALRLNPKIDRARVFVLGHSLGGMLIPRIAAADPALAGVIVMAGAARPIEEAILEQTRYIAMADGSISPEEQTQIDAAAALAAKVKALTPADAKSGASISGAPASYWLDLRGYDPPSAARGIKVPILVLQGERDYQVTMAEFERWRAALAGRPNVTFHTYPSLNHLFIEGTGKSLPSEYDTPGHVAEPVVRDLAAWIQHPTSGTSGSGL